MATQAQLLARLEAIQALIASGVEKAAYDGKVSDFRDLNQLRSIEAYLLSALGLSTRVRRTVASYRSGFGPVEGGGR